MKSESRSIGVINVYVSQYVLRQIAPFTHTLCKFATSREFWAPKARKSGEATRKRDGMVTNCWFQISMSMLQVLYHIWKSVRTDFRV